MEKRRKNRIILSRRYSDTRFRRKKTGSSHKCIMKIRCSDVIRVFGYRKGDKFRILRIERDHKISDNG